MYIKLIKQILFLRDIDTVTNLIMNIKNLLEKNGLIISGCSSDGTLVEVVELKGHPWFLGCQFHPEFTSKPVEGHPLFMAFINSIKDITMKHNFDFNLNRKNCFF